MRPDLSRTRFATAAPTASAAVMTPYTSGPVVWVSPRLTVYLTDQARTATDMISGRRSAIVRTTVRGNSVACIGGSALSCGGCRNGCAPRALIDEESVGAFGLDRLLEIG